MEVRNSHGVPVNFNAAVLLMDDEIRERLHYAGLCDPQSFFDAYCKEHYRVFGEVFEPDQESPAY